MSKLIKQTKAVYAAFTDADGNMTKRPHGVLQRKNLPDDHVEFLRRYLEFMMNSKLLNEATKIYIRSPYMTAKGAFNAYNEENPDKARPIATLVSGMDYCRKKVITTVFPDDMLGYVMELPQKADMKHYWDLLHDAMEKYKQDSVLADAVTVKLPRRINIIAPTDDEICDFLVAIAPYRKGTVKQCEKDISAKYADVVGYINYIASCTAPTVDERWKFEIVRDFLNGENDALSYLDTKDK